MPSSRTPSRERVECLPDEKGNRDVMARLIRGSQKVSPRKPPSKGENVVEIVTEKRELQNRGVEHDRERTECDGRPELGARRARKSDLTQLRSLATKPNGALSGARPVWLPFRSIRNSPPMRDSCAGVRRPHASSA